MPRNALGRGLGALIREPEPTAVVDSQTPASLAKVGGAAAAPAREPVHHGPPLDLMEIIVLSLTALRRRRSRCSTRILVSASVPP